LLSRIGSAGWLATRVEQDIELQRDPLSDLQTAARVQALTIDTMTTTLAELDLSRATVLMRGPRTELANAFAKLGRKESYVIEDPFVTPPGATANLGAPVGSTAAPVKLSQLEPALTSRPPTRLLLAAQLHLLAAHFEEDGGAVGGGFGKALALHAGYRFVRGFSGGLRLAVGDYSSDEVFSSEPFSVTPIDVGAFGRLEFKGNSWLEANLGLHMDRITDSMPTTRSPTSVGYGLTIGREVFIAGPARFGVLLGLSAAQSGSKAAFFGILLGI
jgi:hypothetical protein